MNRPYLIGVEGFMETGNQFEGFMVRGRHFILRAAFRLFALARAGGVESRMGEHRTSNVELREARTRTQEVAGELSFLSMHWEP
jgi:hypothetical protein